MRTTVTIDDELLAEAKVLAAQTRRTLSAVFEDGLREQVHRAKTRPTEDFNLPTSGTPDGTPLVDRYDREALAEALGDNELTPTGPANRHTHAQPGPRA